MILYIHLICICKTPAVRFDTKITPCIIESPDNTGSIWLLSARSPFKSSTIPACFPSETENKEDLCGSE